MSGPGNETNPAEDPWTLYRRLHGMTDQRSMDASARAVPQFQPMQYPNGMQQPMFHPGFSVPMTATAGGATYRTVGPNQANSGFGAAAFSSALGQGMGHASTPGSMKSSAFDLLGSARPQGHMQQQGFDPTSPSMPSNPAHSNQILSQALHQALTGEKRSIPVWNGHPSTLRSWLKLLALWEHESQMPLERRGVKLLQSFAEGSEPRRIADTVPMQTLLSPQGYSAVLSAIYDKYFPYLEASAPKAIDRFLFEGERQKSESFTAFIASKQLARQEMETQMGETISDRLCGRILLRQAGLSDFQREMLMLRGPVLRTFDEVATMLRTLDRPEMLAKAQGSNAATRNFATFGDDTGEVEEHEHLENDEDDSTGSSLQDEDGNPFVYFEDKTYTENESMEILAYHSAYRDVRKEMQKRRNERGYVKRSNDSGKGRGKRSHKVSKGFGKGKSKFSKGSKVLKSYEDDLMSRTRCFNCDELGHISKDCPFKQDPKPRSSTGTSLPRKQFLMTATGPQVFMHSVGRPSDGADNPIYRLIFHTVQCRGHEALVDTAAEEGVIGDVAFAELERELNRRGLRPVWQPQQGPLPGAGGIGGAAVVKGVVNVPLGVAGTNGVLPFTVLQDGPNHRTPPLLPIAWLESVGATIDCQNDQLILQDGSATPMRKLPTKHRAVDIMNFSADGWDLPRNLRRDPNVDPFVLPPQPQTFAAVLQQPDQNKVLVYLLVDDKMNLLMELPVQNRMVVPSDCPGLQDPEALEPERLTHIFSEGRHRVIRDFWKDRHAKRATQAPWYGAVVFASKQHLIAPADDSNATPIQADRSSRMAFPGHVSHDVSQAAAASSSSSSSRWADNARREYGGKRSLSGDQSTSCPVSSSSFSCMEHTINIFDFAMFAPNVPDTVITPTATLTSSPCDPAQAATSAAASAPPMQVPSIAAGWNGQTQHFDLSQFDDVVIELHDNSPCHDLRSSDDLQPSDVQQSFNKQDFGSAVAPMSFSFAPLLMRAFVETSTAQPFSMLKGIKDVLSTKLCSRRASPNVIAVPVCSKADADGGHRDATEAESQQASGMAPGGPSVADFDGNHAIRDGHEVPDQQAWHDGHRRHGREKEGPDGPQKEGSRLKDPPSNWQTSQPVPSPKEVESGGEQLCSRGGVSTSPSWQRSLLVHMPSMWRTLGTIGNNLFKFNTGGSDHGVQLPNVPATAKKQTRFANPEGDGDQRGPVHVSRRTVAFDQSPESPWPNLRQADWPEPNAKIKDSGGDSWKFGGSCQRDVRAGQRLREPDLRGRSNGVHRGGDRTAECRGPGGAGDGCDGHRIRLCDSHGKRADLGSMTDEKVKDLRVSTKLIHSHQLKDGGLKRRLASTSKMAAILLMTFVSTCEASWNMPGIQSFVQCPYWLGQPQHMFQRTSEKEEWEPFSVQTRPRSKELHTCMVFPLNSNNYNLFAEDLEWQCKPLSLPKGVKIFLQKSVGTHVDVMEIYSPP